MIMKKTLLTFCLISALAHSLRAEEDIVKKGLNFGPLPALAYDADKGFQYGAILQIYDFGDGSLYPNFKSYWYLESSWFTKGSQLYTIMNDTKGLIPGIRICSTLQAQVDKAFDFNGFNGYQGKYDFKRIDKDISGEDFLYSPFYKIARTRIIAKSDFLGKITDKLQWEVGYHFNYTRQGTIDFESINKGKKAAEQFPSTEPTLFDLYKRFGIISEDEASGGFTSSIWAGLRYDTRNKESAPSSGIWAETHIIAAPKWLGTTHERYRYALTWRHYLPIITNDVLTFAYRLMYEGSLGGKTPYYELPFSTVMGPDNDKDAMGGYGTCRGIMRNRVVGKDMFAYTAEIRWRFLKFHLFNQNVALGLSAFTDGAMVTRAYDVSFRGANTADKSLYDKFIGSASDEKLHMSTGAGLRGIINQNFIVAAEYGLPFSKLADKNNPIYRQDGDGAFYINLGYLF